MSISRVSAEVKLVHLYRCNNCAAVREGDTVRLSVEAMNPADLLLAITATQPTGYYMPNGWASYPNNRFRCERCPHP